MVLDRAVPWMLLSCLVGCGGAHANAKVSTEASAEAEVDFDKEGAVGTGATDAEGTSSGSSSAAQVDAKAEPPALYGARHDVRLSDPGKSVVCQCLAAVRGAATLEGLTWSDSLPKLDAATQTLVVIESEGIQCSDPKAPGASYMGYHKDGDNVVIDLEAAHPGRPVTRGAIVPLPGEGGHVMISAPKSLPYGKGLKDGDPCTL